MHVVTHKNKLLLVAVVAVVVFVLKQNEIVMIIPT